ncbi:MAG: hypothetical protein IPG48_06965 [Saprospiraceae bacterium]|nr:hypothetical protein [Saprospiraceae bacterium]
MENEQHEEGEITFARIEVKTGVSQLGNVQVNLLEPIHEGDKIVTKGAFYLQSHLTKRIRWRRARSLAWKSIIIYF